METGDNTEKIWAYWFLAKQAFKGTRHCVNQQCTSFWMHVQIQYTFFVFH